MNHAERARRSLTAAEDRFAAAVAGLPADEAERLQDIAATTPPAHLRPLAALLLAEADARAAELAVEGKLVPESDEVRAEAHRRKG